MPSNPSNPSNRWRGDCSRCAALCCVSLAFDRGEAFAFDKAAGEACPLLGPGHACSIHAQRAQQGFGGCVAYDCLGAGQRVTAELFGGRSWQAEPHLLRPMLDAFWRLREVRQLLLGLALTERLELEPALAERRRRLERELDPPGGFDRAALEALELEVVGREVRELLASVRHRLGASAREPRRLSRGRLAPLPTR